MKKTMQNTTFSETPVKNEELGADVPHVSSSHNSVVFAEQEQDFAEQEQDSVVSLNLTHYMQENILHDPSIESANFTSPLVMYNDEQMQPMYHLDSFLVTDFSAPTSLHFTHFETPNMRADERQDILLLQDILENPSSLPPLVFSAFDAKNTVEQEHISATDVVQFEQNTSCTNLAQNYYTTTDENENITILTLQSILGST